MKDTGKFIAAIMVAFSFFSLPVHAKKVQQHQNVQQTKTEAKSNARRNQLDNPFTLELYDNCPKVTMALMEEVALKATIPGYKGKITVKYNTWPEEKYAYPLLDYYTCCIRIKNAMEKSCNKKFRLLFNTKIDGSGTAVDFSTAQIATESAVALINCGENTVYAIYKPEE